MPRLPATTFGGRTAFTPRHVAAPKTEAELADLVRSARVRGQKLRVVGSGHSWAPLAACPDGMVQLVDMEGEPTLDGQRRVVDAPAGMTLHTLCEWLAVRGFALPILGTIDRQSLAGALSTGTHGSSLRHGCLAEGLVSVRLVDGRGEVLDLDEADPMLPAARVSLGALGIFTRVRLRVEPAFRLVERCEPLPFAAARDRVQDFAREHEYPKLWWLPHTDTCLKYHIDRLPPGAPDPAGAKVWEGLPRWLDQHLVNDLVFAGVLRAGALLPAAIPLLNRVVGLTLFAPRLRVGRSDRVFTISNPPAHLETEWALPLPHAAEALDALRALCAEEGMHTNFIQELRFVAADSAWLSPAHGRESFYLSGYTAEAWPNQDPPRVRRLLEGVEALARHLGGRPHWGKLHGWRPGDLDALYPRAADFRALVAAHDPDGVFRTEYLAGILG